MNVANLNPMVAPVQPVQPVKSGGGGTFIYVIVVIMLLVSLIAAGYLFYKSQSPRVVDQFPPGYVGPKPDPSPGPPSYVGPSPGPSYTNVEPLDTEPETIRITDGGSTVENYIIMPTNIDYEYQTYAYNPKDTSLNGSAITFDHETNKCPDGTLDCLYYTRVEDAWHGVKRVKSISDKDGNDLIEKFMDDLWNGKLLLLETPESVEMMKAYELNEKRQLIRNGKVLKPGVDLNVGQYLLIFSVMYKETGLPRPKIVYDFSPKRLQPITINNKKPNATDAAAKKIDDVTEDVSSVEREMGDLGSDVDQKPQTETSPDQTTLNDKSTNITFVSPSVGQETPTLDESVTFVTPVKNEGVVQEIQQVGGVSQGIQEIPTKDRLVSQEIQQVGGGVVQEIQQVGGGGVSQGIQQVEKKKGSPFQNNANKAVARLDGLMAGGGNATTKAERIEEITDARNEAEQAIAHAVETGGYNPYDGTTNLPTKVQLMREPKPKNKSKMNIQQVGGGVVQEINSYI